ncbi:hypothetical protein P152DRAFT_446800 [Eremomyces bilateralis CBS 781.70]|uniref:Uncharacterized protein n=1 Tax=Eremomyces bilateralis CBS 781.70 TaxID=1392243 RepID=A0A6G1GD07_9PEZI|nr:uncharacterized protein P152DRAFT_446800 [Eremomyces bilateralis CBS 781.70]KAF1815781.1 hypothetical protein P152DRAFT_446800 [Eremomyces bilateralis CBS 781.70]
MVAPALMDAQTSTAIAAIVIASLAFFIALAQVLQQYFQTGHSIRLCDSVVYGPLPGKGKRVWQRDQWRFRVIYSIPQICLDPSIWPSEAPSYAVGEHKLELIAENTKEEKQPDPLELEDSLVAIPVRHEWFSTTSSRSLTVPKASATPALKDMNAGEASWASFIRATESGCGDSVRYDVVTADADRVPSDLNTVPMLVSMREIIIMGLMAEMEVTKFSFSTRLLAMQGTIGSISSSHHPTLGLVLHFAPRPLRNGKHQRERALTPSLWRGYVSRWWLVRTWDSVAVAGKHYDSHRRRTSRKLDKRWRRDNLRNAEYVIHHPSHSDDLIWHRPGKEPDTAFVQQNDLDPKPVHKSTPSIIEEMKEAAWEETSYSIHAEATVRRHEHDGVWTFYLPKKAKDKIAPRKSIRATALSNEENTANEEREQQGKNTAREWTQYKAPLNGHRPSEADILGPKVSQGNLSEKVQEIYEPEPIQKLGRRATVEDATDQGEGDGEEADNTGLSHYTHFQIPAATDRSDTGGLVTDQRRSAAEARQAARDEAYHRQNPDKTIASKIYERDEKRQKVREKALKRELQRRRRNREREADIGLQDVCPFWWSQIDTIDGPWATPWKKNLGVPTEDALVGGIMVVLEALLGFLDEDSLVYVYPYSWQGAAFQHAVNFLTVEKRSSWPPYAINGQRGVIADGVLEGSLVSAFANPVPVLELLWSYEWQIADIYLWDHPLRLLNAEIVRIDAWLSYVGRLPEIIDGKGQLLDNVPALVQLLSEEFEQDFITLDQSAEGDGYQDIQSLVGNVLDFFIEDENLSEPEQLYLLVALLRTYKVCQCIQMGEDTKPLEEVILRDIQAYMV